jgi:biotin operon repressor
MDEAIKEAFSRVKQDIFSLGNELSNLKLLILDMKNELKILTKAFKDSQNPEELQESIPTHIPTHPTETPTIQQINPTQEETPTDKLLSQVLRSQNKQVSIGNEGVPTNKPTNQQTNQHIIQHINLPTTIPIKPQISQQLPTTIEKTEEKKETRIDQLSKIDEILTSLDSLKKELRMKIKRLTNQEMAVFSLLYSLENQGNEVDYPLLSSKLSLSEASIRDYIGKIQKKGIPIIKEKINNKKIILHLSQDFKKIASLDTIIKLREL